MYVAEAFDLYIRKRLVDVALKRRSPRRQLHPHMGHVDPSIVKPLGDYKFSVASASKRHTRLVETK